MKTDGRLYDESFKFNILSFVLICYLRVYRKLPFRNECFHEMTTSRSKFFHKDVLLCVQKARKQQNCANQFREKFYLTSVNFFTSINIYIPILSLSQHESA